MPFNDTQHREDWYKKAGFPDAADANLWCGDSSDMVIPRLADAGCSTHKPPPRSAGFRVNSKKLRRTKIISLSVCALLFAAAVGVSAWQIADNYFSADRSQAAGSSAVIMPGGNDGKNSPTEDYNTYQEYFADVYSESSNTKIPLAETDASVTLTLNPKPEGELTLQEIYAQVNPAVVGVTVYKNGEKSIWGTGVVFSSDGYIITNAHVLQSGDSVEVTFEDGTVCEALLVGLDESSDIAVLHIDGSGYPYAEFGDSDELQVGESVCAIGNPLGEAYSGTMTNGILSGINRTLFNNGHSMTLLQTNAAINEGSSGGPLINAYGQVIGITNMKIMSPYYATVEGIGFAIPSSVVKQVTDQLMKYGVVPGEPTIGIVAGSVPSEAMSAYDLPSGVYVSEVNDNTDAKTQGLQEGDIIVKVNGISVSSVAEINAIKEEYTVGDTLSLLVFRDGETFEISIKLIDKSDVQY